MQRFVIYFCALVCLLVIASFAVHLALVVVMVEGPSMCPQLKHGDRVLVLRIWPRSWIRKGHIVLVSPWILPQQSRKLSSMPMPFIKRVAAVAGDTIVTSISDLAANYQVDYRLAHDSEGNRTWHIPSKHLFVLSDNLHEGYDSRSWGPVPYHTVLGVVIKRLASKRASTGIDNPVTRVARPEPPGAGERT